MTIAEAEVFYNMDKEKYNLATNKEFLNWYNKQLKNGYLGYMEISEMQELIDNIVIWYEIKYPNREFEMLKGTEFNDFKDIESISKNLTIEQLMFRLPHNQYCIIEGGYRARGWGYPDQIFMKVDIEEPNRFPYELISVNYKTGIVNQMSLLSLNIDRDKEIKLDELIKILENLNRKLNLQELEACVNNHNIDLELRKKLLQFVALKLLYSKNTIPENGYERAKRFIEEFNENIPNLKLSTSGIDKIMNINYMEEYEKAKSKKLLFK